MRSLRDKADERLSASTNTPSPRRRPPPLHPAQAEQVAASASSALSCWERETREAESSESNRGAAASVPVGTEPVLRRVCPWHPVHTPCQRSGWWRLTPVAREFCREPPGCLGAVASRGCPPRPLGGRLHRLGQRFSHPQVTTDLDTQRAKPPTLRPLSPKLVLPMCGQAFQGTISVTPKEKKCSGVRIKSVH